MKFLFRTVNCKIVLSQFNRSTSIMLTFEHKITDNLRNKPDEIEIIYESKNEEPMKSYKSSNQKDFFVLSGKKYFIKKENEKIISLEVNEFQCKIDINNGEVEYKNE